LNKYWIRTLLTSSIPKTTIKSKFDQTFDEKMTFKLWSRYKKSQDSLNFDLRDSQKWMAREIAQKIENNKSARLKVIKIVEALIEAIVERVLKSKDIGY